MAFWRRMQYAWVMAREKKSALQVVVRTQEFQLKTLTDLDLTALAAQGIEILVLDFDGVMAPHGDIAPHPVVAKWLTSVLSSFPGKVVVLSNQPLEARITYLKQHFPTLIWHQAEYKKPYPDGLLDICQQHDCVPEACLLVDDRLLTGGLAASLAGTGVRWVTQPYINISAHPFVERWFALLRWLEKKWLQ